jgi:hypothetical protein
VFHVSNTLSNLFIYVLPRNQVFDYDTGMNTRDLIEAVGGVRAAARVLGVAPSTVHYYCKHDRMPFWRLLLLMSVIDNKGKIPHQKIMKEYVIERHPNIR